MPSFQTWGHVAQHARLPPTPPEYKAIYLTPTSALSDQSFYSSHSVQQHNGQTGRDFIERYSQAPSHSVAQQTVNISAQAHMSQPQPTRDFRHVPAYVAQASGQFQYGPISAPLLPPIRIPDPIDTTVPQYQHRPSEPKQKEEKPTGGVAAHLDYDMDLMSSFVAEMAQGIVSPGIPPSTQFRKYVSQILSSTRLPSSTIMLGMFYLASRMKIISARGEETKSSGTVYRMLTTCLLLGSKFLDDNTFQNRSWAEVSSIPVQELNRMELQWLEGFNWTIHGPMYDQEDGFFMWIKHWHAYEEKAEVAKAKEFQKLTPIDTTLRSTQSYKHQPLMSPEGPIPPQYQRGPQYDTQWVRPFISEYSPPSAPHSGPATPDYYGSTTWAYTQAPPPYTRQGWTHNAVAPYTSQRSQPPSYQHTPSYAQQYSHPGWGSHGPTCVCMLCARQSEQLFNQSHFAHGPYSLQPVAG